MSVTVKIASGLTIWQSPVVPLRSRGPVRSQRSYGSCRLAWPDSTRCGETRHGQARPLPATGVQISVPLPAGSTYASSNADDGSYDSTTGVWTVGKVPLGTPITLQINTTVASASTSTLTATEVSLDQFDMVTANNSASASVNPQDADLSVHISGAPAMGVDGQPITIQITVSNDGPDDGAVTVSAQLVDLVGRG